MQQKQIDKIGVLMGGLLAMALLTPALGESQTPEPLQQVEKRLADKQEAAAAHRKKMEGIKDTAQLAIEMQHHFHMTEEMLALMLERRKIVAAETPASNAPTGQGSGMVSGNIPDMSTIGHGMGPGGGMMQKKMGGMQGSGMQSPKMGQQGMASMSGSRQSGQATPGVQSGQDTSGSNIEQLQQRIAEHAAYMETVRDPAILTQEMLRHQKMLDHMLQLMQ